MSTPPIELSADRGRIRLTLRCIRMGDDLCVTLAGGDREHIGAVALSQPYPSREEVGKTSATTSVIALREHREDDLARRMASRLSAGTAAVVCVACGIHLEAIRPDELAEVLAMAEELTTALLALLSDRNG